jgi:3-methylfumaryl-CoA hydratase
VLSDRVAAVPARALAATLNRDDAIPTTPGSPLPALWIWLSFLPIVPMSQVGADGHPKRGGFLPPIELPRRMWAGSRCVFHAPIRVGDQVERTSEIARVAEKAGKTGSMVFVTVRHTVRAEGALAIEEEQDVVYVGIPDRFEPPPPTPLPVCAWSEPVAIDPVFLFRFSALTFNGHRIHYDRTYATDTERYPGLVVHGPLQAILLFDAALKRHPDRRPAQFEFRGVRPLFDFDRVTVNGRNDDTGALELFTANTDNAVCMQAKLRWAP